MFVRVARKAAHWLMVSENQVRNSKRRRPHSEAQLNQREMAVWPSMVQSKQQNKILKSKYENE
jgi:hypothetical protein